MLVSVLTLKACCGALPARSVFFFQLLYTLAEKDRRVNRLLC